MKKRGYITHFLLGVFSLLLCALPYNSSATIRSWFRSNFWHLTDSVVMEKFGLEAFEIIVKDKHPELYVMAGLASPVDSTAILAGYSVKKHCGSLLTGQYQVFRYLLSDRNLFLSDKMVKSAFSPEYALQFKYRKRICRVLYSPNSYQLFIYVSDNSGMLLEKYVTLSDIVGFDRFFLMSTGMDTQNNRGVSSGIQYRQNP